ncbi:MAG: hypothetical protein MHM6MM_006244 [Cercozoa sp. M6MM]
MRFLTFVVALTVLFLGAVADQKVPLSIASSTCVNLGKCINDRGEFDSSICCSGVCDKDDGCLSTTEAASVLLRVNSVGAPFICKTETFFGVRACQPVIFDAGTLPPECLCGPDKPCLIGNGATELCSSRYWIGSCNPEDSECVPQLQVSVSAAKMLFNRDPLELDGGLSSPCLSSNDNCASFGAGFSCKTSCATHVATAILDDGNQRLGVETLDGNTATTPPIDPFMRDVNPEGFTTIDGICTASGLALGESCVCDADCTSGYCFISRGGSLATLPVSAQSLVDDISFTGTCVIPSAGFLRANSVSVATLPCDKHCDCLPGHKCLPHPSGSPNACKAPNGIGPCTDGDDCISGFCSVDGAGNSKCAAVAFGDRCQFDEQCEFGATCAVEPGKIFVVQCLAGQTTHPPKLRRSSTCTLPLVGCSSSRCRLRAALRLLPSVLREAERQVVALKAQALVRR